jgi:hypothetical protein
VRTGVAQLAAKVPLRTAKLNARNEKLRPMARPPTDSAYAVNGELRMVVVS